MAETTGGKPAGANPPPVVEDRSFVDILRSLIGKVVTVVNPESYEDAPIGHQIRAGFYRAKPVGLGRDYLIVVTEYKHKTDKEPVKQYIPITKIKRVSMMKTELLIHI